MLAPVYISFLLQLARFLFLTLLSLWVLFILQSCSRSDYAPQYRTRLQQILGHPQPYNFHDEPETIPLQIAFSHDNHFLTAQLRNGNILRWDLRVGTADIIAMTQSEIFAIQPQNQTLITKDEQHRIQLIDAKNRKITTVANGHYDYASLAETGLLALANNDKRIDIFATSQATLFDSLKTLMPVRNGVTIAPDGRLIAAAEGLYQNGSGHETLLEIWDLRNANHWFIDERKQGNILGMWKIRISRDNKLAVTSQHNGKSGIRVWDLNQKHEIFRKENFKSYWVRALNFSYSGDLLLSGDEKGFLRLWRIADSKLVYEKKLHLPIQAVAFSNDARLIAYVLWDSTIHVASLVKINPVKPEN